MKTKSVTRLLILSKTIKEIYNHLSTNLVFIAASCNKTQELLKKLMAGKKGYLDVWAQNLKSALVSVETVSRTNPLVAIDIEFPGDPFGSDECWMISGRRQRAYDVMRRNVNATKWSLWGCTSAITMGTRESCTRFTST